LVFASAIEATEADDQVAEGGEILGSVPGAGGRAILAEGDIADVVDGILDAPVTPAEGLDLSGIHLGGGAAGEEDFGLFGNAKGFEMMSGAVDHGSLDGVGKSGGFGSDVERINLPGFMPAVRLVQSEVRRGKRRRSRP